MRALLLSSALLTLPMLAAAQASSPQPASASAPGAAASAPLVSKTSDGRDFASLTQKEFGALTRPEKRQHLAWQEAMIAAQDERIKALDEEQARIDAAHAAQQTLKSLMVTYKANGRLTNAEQAQAREALKNPLVPEGLRANLQKLFGL